MGVTIREIADACDVSRGTVDRALHNRGRVQPEVKERILKTARELGYEPNISARVLSLMKQDNVFGVILQFAATPFIKAVSEGIDEAVAEITAYGCRIWREEIADADDMKVVQIMQKMKEQDVKGIALVATESFAIREAIRACERSGIHVVTFNSDLPDSGRLCFVGEPSQKGGRTAAGIFADILPENGKIAVFSGRRSSRVQNQREAGFLEVLGKNNPAVRVVRVLYTEDDPETLKSGLWNILQNYPDLAGIYINTQGVPEACGLLREKGLNKNVRVVVHDLDLCRREDILDGTIDYIIDVNAKEQGYRPLMLLFDVVVNKKIPEKEHYDTDVRILSRYNLPD